MLFVILELTNPLTLLRALVPNLVLFKCVSKLDLEIINSPRIAI